MTMATFKRAVGPRADVRELEYVAALQQTCANETRVCGTVSSIDILRYLKSRHGLEISHSQARDIVRGLGGGTAAKDVMKSVSESVAKKQSQSVAVERHEKWKNTSKNDGEDHDEMLLGELVGPRILYLDLVQMTSILLIPTLLRFAAEWKRQNHQRW